MMKKTVQQKKIKVTLEISKPLNTREKLIRHILPSLNKPHDFCMKQFFIKSYFRIASYANYPIYQH